ncbi:spore germination protein KB [Paenibacillus sp. V4I3]|uniref:GerAB/ArcD/ProY family transporter n=1 Tax=Paenibacillus sp. V4I3 TaxID=3042305 RepID=UPI00277D7FF4|nr:endospore germination permease [Paenibacillus sp. V4I3]MDQ0877607.1 spore germination protein KB [Paenibacillus sp. V4I3]
MKISNWQLFWLMATVEISMTIWLTIAPTIQKANQDAWISLILAGIVGMAITYSVTKLSSLFPSLTIVQFSQHILGKWVGRTVCLLYFAGWYTVAAVILRVMSEFLQQMLFHDTPSWVISIIMITAMIYVNYKGGIEGIARFSEIAGPLIVLGIVFTLLLNTTNLKLKLLLPVYADTGLLPILKGSLHNASFLGESIMIMMITPFLLKPERSLKYALMAILFPSLLVTVSTIMVITTFGTKMGGQLFYPYFTMVRFISFLDFVQNMDVWIIFIWIFSVFVKLSLYLFINSYGTAQLLNIKNSKSLVLFVAAFLFIISIIPLNAVSVMEYADRVWIKYVFPINIIALPIVMLIVGHFRRVRTRCD